MLLPPDIAIHFAWFAWLVSWMAAAGWRKPTLKRPPTLAEIGHLAPTILGAGMLFSTHALWSDPSRQLFNNVRASIAPIQLWGTPVSVGWALFALAVLGFLICWWARVYLGQLWSGTVTVKPGHRVVDTGPYRLVRHPIYTGLLLALLATALEKATIIGFLGLALIVVGIWLKARLEERFLRQELGREAYDSYAARTPMLVPIRL